MYEFAMNLQRDIKSLRIPTLGSRENGIVLLISLGVMLIEKWILFLDAHCPVLIPNSVLFPFMEIPLHGLLQS